MPRKNDDSLNPVDWTNRKLMATIRAYLYQFTDCPPWYTVEQAYNEIERRFVRSSSRN